MAHAARALGLGVMLGCMIESGLGIAAGCAVAPLCDHVDLDGNLLIAEDPWPGVAFIDGVQVPSDRPGLGVASERLLLLAEGFSGDPHYGKTARGVLALPANAGRRAPRLDPRGGDGGRRADRRRPSNDALCFDPTMAIVGVATQGGRFPPAWRELLKSCIAKGLHVENGLHEFLTDDRGADRACGAPRRRAARPAPPAGRPQRPKRRQSEGAGADRAHRRLRLRDREDDGLARARSGGAGPRARGRASSRPARRESRSPAGESPSTRSSRTSSPARPSGSSSRARARGRALLVEGQGSLTHPAYSGVTLGLIHGSAPHVFVLCHMAGATEVEGYPGHPLLSLPELVDLHERISLPARRATVACHRAQHASAGATTRRARRSPRPRPRRVSCRRPGRFGAGRLLDAVVAAL